MNEVDLLRRWGLELEPSDSAPSASVRARVLRRESPRRRRAPQLAWSIGLSAVLAAAIVAVVVWPSTPRDADAPPNRPDAALTADQILRRAAVLVAKQTEAPPRADRFVFTERVFAGSTTGDGTDGKPDDPQLRQAWDSVDGTRDGLIRGRATTGRDWAFTETVHVCRNGKMRGETMPCRTVPQFLPDLPTDATAMLEYLKTRPATKDAPVDPNVAVFGAGLDLLNGNYLLPATRAAVFEALSRLPGVTVREGVTDLAGRPGVALRGTPSGVAAPGTKAGELILDPKTYAFLGTNHSAVLRQAVVDAPGELP